MKNSAFITILNNSTVVVNDMKITDGTFPFVSNISLCADNAEDLEYYSGSYDTILVFEESNIKDIELLDIINGEFSIDVLIDGNTTHDQAIVTITKGMLKYIKKEMNSALDFK